MAQKTIISYLLFWPFLLLVFRFHSHPTSNATTHLRELSWNTRFSNRLDLISLGWKRLVVAAALQFTFRQCKSCFFCKAEDAPCCRNDCDCSGSREEEGGHWNLMAPLLVSWSLPMPRKWIRRVRFYLARSMRCMELKGLRKLTICSAFEGLCTKRFSL